MTDASGNTHKLLLMRNPWGTSYYSGTWSKDDPNWTDDLVAQVPMGMDPRVDQATKGIFVFPMSSLGPDEQGVACFNDFQIADMRDEEGY
mmetsp:Transcript_13133/g.22195  ORF Transcript_13133/g.22195 Transcript_13133/m.22195 type:complete len:90 (+) Transcript_13133:982-1251(+)